MSLNETRIFDTAALSLEPLLPSSASLSSLAAVIASAQSPQHATSTVNADQGAGLTSGSQSLRSDQLLQRALQDKSKLATFCSALEGRVLELQTQLVQSNQSLGLLRETLSMKEDAMKTQLAEMEEQMINQKDRLRTAPLLDDAYLQLYLELRTQVADRLNGPSFTKAERDAAVRLVPVAIMDRLRLWVRKLLAQVAAHVEAQAHRDRISGAASGLAKNTSFSLGQIQLESTGVFSNTDSSFRLPPHASPSLASGAGSPNPPGPSFCHPMETTSTMGLGRKPSIKATGQSLHNRIPLHDPSDHHEVDSVSTEALQGGDLHRFVGLSGEIDDLKTQIGALQHELALERENSAGAIRSLEIRTDIARREAGAAKQDLRKKETLIQQLQEDLRQRKEAEAAQQTLERCQREAAEAKKNLKILTEAKQQEIVLLRRTFEEEMKEMQKQLAFYQRQRMENQKLETELRETKAEAQSMKGQLARSNVKDLIAEKRHAEGVVRAQHDKIIELENTLAGKEGILHHLEDTNKRMTEQYTAIFEAHVKERQMQKQSRAKTMDQRIDRAMKGPNSELNMEYYRTRYEEVLDDLKQTQRKMKQLLLFSSHDHLAYAKRATVTESQLLSLRDDVDHLEVRNSELIDALEEMQSGPERSILRSTEETNRLLGEAADESRQLVTPSVRIQEDSTLVDITVPSIGVSRTPFGGPLDQGEILRLRTTIPSPSLEASTRSISWFGSNTPPEGTTQEVIQRRSQPLQKRTPGLGSTRGKTFDFTSVGRSRVNTSAIKSLVSRPKSADLSSLQPSAH